MAAPIIAIAGKFLAKQAAGKAAGAAASKVTSGGGGGGGEDENKERSIVLILASALALVILIVALTSVYQGVINGAGAVLSGAHKNTGDNFCAANTAIVDEFKPEDALHEPSTGSIGGKITPFDRVSSLPDLDGTQLTMPVRVAKLNMSSDYGPRSRPCAGCSNWHKGIDYAHPAGTPTLAIGPGVVTYAQYDEGSGNMVRIQHKYKGSVITTVYMHHFVTKVKVGDIVGAGDVVGSVGKTGKWSTGNHLHFEIWMGTEYKNHSDPKIFFAGNSVVTEVEMPQGGVSATDALNGVYGDKDDKELTSLIVEFCDLNAPVDDFGDYGTGSSDGVGSGGWGGHSNGRIPASALAPVPWAPGTLLRKDAVDALIQLNVAYKAKFGVNIVSSGGYRTYDAQVALKKQKPILAGKPGTSNHGWGLALDIGGGVNSGHHSPQYKWMDANAPKYGWVNPNWARANGSKPESWHFEYVGVAGGGSTANATTPAGAKVVARTLVTQKGWNESQFVCLEKLWERESNWNYKAENRSSGAYGIPQSLPGKKMASVGEDWKTNPKTQIVWGLQYIKDRYKTPCGAWAHSEKENWY